MKYPHRIRLRGPWECKPLSRHDGGPLPESVRMRLPCRWKEGGLGDFAGKAQFCRRFGYPGQIDETERVWLTFEGAEGCGAITLNGSPLGALTDQPAAFEVTALLAVRNELLVELEADESGGLWGEVALEIRKTAYLEAVEAVLESEELTVRGRVVGTAERPLDLYLIGGRSNLAYQTVMPLAEGAAFELSLQLLPEQVQSVKAEHQESQWLRAELVDAATVWYMLEVPLRSRMDFQGDFFHKQP